MATSGELADTLSRSLGFRLGGVSFYGQALRNAGLLSTGGRGSSAVHMSRDDAANWLIAMCAAETAKSAPAVVKLTRDTPLSGEPDVSGSPIDDLSFMKARKVGELIVALIDDQRAHRLDDVGFTLDFHVGGGWVMLTAHDYGIERSGAWQVSMEFIHTWESGLRQPRFRDPEETPVTAKRRTINRISRGVFEDINKTLGDQ